MCTGATCYRCLTALRVKAALATALRMTRELWSSLCQTEAPAKGILAHGDEKWPREVCVAWMVCVVWMVAGFAQITEAVLVLVRPECTYD